MKRENKKNKNKKKNIICDYLIWTPSLFQIPLNFQKIKKLEKPNFRNIILFHFIINKKIKHNLHLVNIYDKNYISHRVTFYNNLTRNYNNKLNYMTVEIITDKVLINVADKKNMKNIIYNELIEMNLLPKGSKIENYFFQILKNSMILNSNKNLLQILRQKKNN